MLKGGKGRVESRKNAPHGSGFATWLERNRAAVADSLTQRDKPSRFEDRRIGEADNALDPEERALGRLALEHRRRHERRGAFNLPDDAEAPLTHGGRLLSSLNKFDLHFADDDDADAMDAPGEGKLDASGFFVDGDGDEAADGERRPEPALSLREKMAQLIAQTKVDRLQKQRASEQARSVVAEMDAVWTARLRGEHARLRIDKLELKPAEGLSSFDELVAEMQSGVRVVPRAAPAVDGAGARARGQQPLDTAAVSRLVKRLAALRRSHADFAAAHGRWLPPFLPTLRLCHTVLSRLSPRHALSRAAVAFLSECLARSGCRRLPEAARLLVTAHLLQRHLAGVFCAELLRCSAELVQAACPAPDDNGGVAPLHKPELLLPHEADGAVEDGGLRLAWCELEWRPPADLPPHAQLSGCLRALLDLLENLVDGYAHLPARSTCFARHGDLLARLPLTRLAPGLRTSAAALATRLAAVSCAKEAPLVREVAPPAMLALLEPRFDEHFDPARHKRRAAAVLAGDSSRDMREAKRLQQKLRKETKSTAREIRRDTAATACLKLEATKKADEARRAKVKQIYSELANQEGEYRKMKKSSVVRATLPQAADGGTA